MPYVTPPVYTSSNGYGFADVNRTNENIDYIRNQDAQFIGDKTFYNPLSGVVSANILFGTASNVESASIDVLTVSGLAANMRFLLDDNTGFLRERMTVVWNGKIGINNNSPLYQLDVHSASEDVFRIYNANSGIVSTKILFGSGANVESANIEALTQSALATDLIFNIDNGTSLAEAGRFTWNGYFKTDGQIIAGGNAPTAIGRFYAGETITEHAHYGFIDDSIINYGQVANQGHASFNSNVKIQGVEDSDHHNCFQSYPDFNFTGTMVSSAGFFMQPEVTNGTITTLSQFTANNPIKTGGTIAGLFGLLVNELTEGVQNYAVRTVGKTPNWFSGDLHFGSTLTTGRIGYNYDDGNLDVVNQNGYATRFITESFDVRPIDIDPKNGNILLINAGIVQNQIGREKTWFGATAGTTGTGSLLTLNITGGIITAGNIIVPATTGNIDNGISALRWGTVYTKDLDLSGNINPTTTPTESTTSVITALNSTILLPRGVYESVEGWVNYSATIVSASPYTTEFQKKNIDGIWETLDTISQSGTFVSNARFSRNFPIVTSGNEYRLKITSIGNNATIFNAYMKYRKS